MHTQVNTTAAAFKTTSTGTRLFSAALSGVCSVGLLFAVVSSMVGQSGGQPLGDFVASHLVEQSAVQVAAATVNNSAS